MRPSLTGFSEFGSIILDSSPRLRRDLLRLCPLLPARQPPGAELSLFGATIRCLQ